MHITDPLYGEFVLEPVLSDLLHSAPLRRLKGVHQGGAVFLVHPRWDVTRFDHSVGVMLLIRRLGGSLGEQIAGLLHDVSHTAFSHVIDYVLGNQAEDFHEGMVDRVVRGSEIPRILARYGMEWQPYLDGSRWPLLEQPLPALCADRIDYTLRDQWRQGGITREEIGSFFGSLAIREGRICVTSVETAEWFTALCYREVTDYFMHPINVYVNGILTEILKRALNEGILTLEDFWLDDEELLDKLTSRGDKVVSARLARLHPRIRWEEVKSESDFHRKGKPRLIDPDVCTGKDGIRRAG